MTVNQIIVLGEIIVKNVYFQFFLPSSLWGPNSILPIRGILNVEWEKYMGKR